MEIFSQSLNLGVKMEVKNRILMLNFLSNQTGLLSLITGGAPFLVKASQE